MVIPDEARRAASRGDVIEAIKLTRARTGLGLREAKDAVDAFLRGESSAAATHGVGARTGAASVAGRNGRDDIPSSAVALLYQGRLIDAIKQTREVQRLGLKDAREAVERYLAANPSVRVRFETAAAEQGNGFMKLLRIVAIAGLITLAYLWLTGGSS